MLWVIVVCLQVRDSLDIRRGCWSHSQRRSDNGTNKNPWSNCGQSCSLGTIQAPTWHHSGRSSWLSVPREDFQFITGLSSRKGKGLEGTWGELVLCNIWIVCVQGGISYTESKKSGYIDWLMFTRLRESPVHVAFRVFMGLMFPKLRYSLSVSGL